MIAKTLVHDLKIDTAILNEHNDPARMYGDTAQQLVDAVHPLKDWTLDDCLAWLMGLGEWANKNLQWREHFKKEEVTGALIVTFLEEEHTKAFTEWLARTHHDLANREAYHAERTYFKAGLKKLLAEFKKANAFRRKMEKPFIMEQRRLNRISDRKERKDLIRMQLEEEVQREVVEIGLRQVRKGGVGWGGVGGGGATLGQKKDRGHLAEPSTRASAKGRVPPPQRCGRPRTAWTRARARARRVRVPPQPPPRYGRPRVLLGAEHARERQGPSTTATAPKMRQAAHCSVAQGGFSTLAQTPMPPPSSTFPCSLAQEADAAAAIAFSQQEAECMGIISKADRDEESAQAELDRLQEEPEPAEEGKEAPPAKTEEQQAAEKAKIEELHKKIADASAAKSEAQLELDHAVAEKVRARHPYRARVWGPRAKGFTGRAKRGGERGGLGGAPERIDRGSGGGSGGRPSESIEGAGGARGGARANRSRERGELWSPPPDSLSASAAAAAGRGLTSTCH
jgi:hypothetical protein